MTLEVCDVSARLGGRDVLKQVSLAVSPGEIIAVVGPNGAGKSTLLRVMAGLLAPTVGDVCLDGQALARLDAKALGRQIAYLPQDRIVHWPMTARRIVELGRLPHRSATAAETEDDRRAIDNALDAMDVRPLAGRSVLELSGGERARVLVARALAQEARFLIADEPTAGLDPAHALSLFATFAKLAADGRSIAVALHDLSLAVRYCHRVALVKDGVMMAAGRPSDVLTEDMLARAYAIRATLIRVGDVVAVVPIEPLPRTV